MDSSFYSTASMLRTIENIVGVPPLTQFDTFATPMVAAFERKADTAPYSALVPAQAGNATNGVDAPMASASQAQKLDKEDSIDEQTFNRAIWKSVKGAHSTMPQPRHSLWGAVPNDVEDDD